MRFNIPESLRYILTLTLVCFVAAVLLSVVYSLTKPRIFQQKERQRAEALKKIMPEAECFELVEHEGGAIYFKAYASADKKELLGYAFKAQAQGYSSIIESMAGLDKRGRITGIEILSQNETPGLGAKINEVLIQKTLWQAIKEIFTPRKKTAELPHEPWFCSQFKGKLVNDLILVRTPSGKNIQAITGATISSAALTDSIREKAKEILEREGK